MESDLSRYHQIDYRDRWRRDSDGNRLLTLRMISVRVRHLPPDSATALALGGSGWRLEHYLAAHLFHATAGKPHPMLPKAERGDSPDRDRKIRKAKDRARERQRALDAGVIA